MEAWAEATIMLLRDLEYQVRINNPLETKTYKPHFEPWGESIVVCIPSGQKGVIYPGSTSTSITFHMYDELIKMSIEPVFSLNLELINQDDFEKLRLILLGWAIKLGEQEWQTKKDEN